MPGRRCAGRFWRGNVSYRLNGGGHPTIPAFLPPSSLLRAARSSKRAHLLLLLSHVTRAAVSILKTNRPEWTGCHPNLTKMKPPRGVGPPGGMYQVDPSYCGPQGGGVQLLTTAVQLPVASLRLTPPLASFVGLRSRILTTFFLVAILSISFVLFVVG